MSGRPWFRMYAEFVGDPKVQLLAFDDQRHFVCILCLKCNGTLDSKTPSVDFRDRMIAKALGLDTISALEARRRLAEVGLVGDDWQPCKWDERQYTHDLSTSRVQRFRERKRNAETDPKRNETVSGTSKSRAEQNKSDGTRARAGEHRRGAPRAPEPPRAAQLAPGQVGDVLRRIVAGGRPEGS